MKMRVFATVVWLGSGGAGLGYMLYDLLGQWGAVLSLPISLAGGIATGLSLADATLRRRELEGRF